MDKRLVLIVDDEPDFLEMVKTRLEANGYRVITAFDGQEALDKTRQENPDLIILDVAIPKLDGYAVCNILKSEAQYRDIPIVMLTGRRQAEDIKTGMNMGAVCYIAKPFKPEVFLGIIQGLVSRAK